jgi:hypothetical protein
MDDEILAGLADLVGVVHARVDERLLDATAVDHDRRVIRMLLDDREQVPEQPPLGDGELGARDGRLRPRMLNAVDRRPGRGDDRRRLADGLAAAGATTLLGGIRRLAAALTRGLGGLAAGGAGAARQALRRRFALLRYRCPSSYLFA